MKKSPVAISKEFLFPSIGYNTHRVSRPPPAPPRLKLVAVVDLGTLVAEGKAAAVHKDTVVAQDKNKGWRPGPWAASVARRKALLASESLAAAACFCLHGA